MKNALLLSIFALVFMASCQKEEAPVVTPSSPIEVREITVDYAIYAASGDVEVVAIIPVDGILTEKTFQVNRTNHTISFQTKSQQKIMIKARNTNPSHDEVLVSIYVDGLLYKSNSTTGLNAWAEALGSPL